MRHFPIKNNERSVAATEVTMRLSLQPDIAPGGIFGYSCVNIQISEKLIMPLYIKDDTTARLVAQFAKLRGVSKQDAVKIAIQAALDRAREAIPLRDRFNALRQAHRLPPATGNVADKAFFDDLSGEV
jgi:antitoxin VapB